MKKLKLASVLLLALLLALLPAASPPAVAGETDIELVDGEMLEVEPGYDYDRLRDQNITLNVYNWGEYISLGNDGETMDVNAVFEELTGIKVNYTTFDTNESLRAKLMSGGADYDVIIPSDYMIGRLIEEGMLAELNFDNIPNYAMIGDMYKNLDFDPDNKYSVPYMWGYVGIIYNTTMVESEVDSWEALWDADYAGDILMFDNSRDAFAIALKKMGNSLNPTSEAEIDQAAAELEKQKSVVQAYVMDQIFDKMEGGEAALAPYYAGDAIQMIAENPDLAFAVPKEGTNYFVDSMCIPASSGNKEAAEMYINFMSESQVSRDNSLYIGYSTPQLEAEALMPDEIKNNPIAYPSDEVLANTETFTVLPEELDSYMDKAWNDMRSQNSGGNGWMILVFLGAALVVIVVLFVWRARKKKRDNY